MSIYQQWLDATNELKSAKDKELELRNLICEEILAQKLEGATTVHVPGFKVTATAKLNRSVDREVLEAIWDGLPDEEKECIDYKPSLKLTAYKKIEIGGGKLLEAVTVKPAQATLKIVPEEE